MKKTWQIILVHICLQASIGGAIILSASGDFDGPLGGLGLIGVYVITALALTLISFLILLNVNKLSSEVALKSASLSILLWFFAPLIVLVFESKLAEKKYPANQNNFTRDFYLICLNSINLQITHGIGNTEVGVIGPTVFALGWNDDFIIVKQHPDLHSKVHSRLFSSVNNRGHYEIKDMSDTIFLLKDDSIYNEYGLWYHVKNDWTSPDSLKPYKGITYYHIIDIRKKMYVEGQYGIYTFDNARNFNLKRFVLSVPKDLDFTTTVPAFQ
jgi:hypothetical protein